MSLNRQASGNTAVGGWEVELDSAANDSFDGDSTYDLAVSLLILGIIQLLLPELEKQATKVGMVSAEVDDEYRIEETSSFITPTANVRMRIRLTPNIPLGDEATQKIRKKMGLVLNYATSVAATSVVQNDIDELYARAAHRRDQASRLRSLTDEDIDAMSEIPDEIRDLLRTAIADGCTVLTFKN